VTEALECVIQGHGPVDVAEQPGVPCNVFEPAGAIRTLTSVAVNLEEHRAENLTRYCSSTQHL